MSEFDHTIDADDSELDRIRQLAAAAQQRQGSASSHDREHTAEADDSTLDQIRRLAAQAEASRSTSALAAPIAPAEIPAAEPARRIPTRAASELAFDEAPINRGPQPRGPAQPWVPPARSMRPDRTVASNGGHAGPWRIATIVLGTALAAIAIVWGVSQLGGGDSNEPATSTTVGNGPTGVVVTAVVGEGGSGG